MASWNSIPLEIAYQVLGWTTFIAWIFAPWPQAILNFRRKSVVGFNFDFVLLNLTKHTSYLIYNATLYFSSDVQKQYFEKYGSKEMIPVAANDVAFSTHAVLLALIHLLQITIYERGSQTFSKVSIGIVSVVLFTAGVCFFIALPTHSWLWLINIFNSIQVVLAAIKYTPQAFMNFKRKSTDGFSIYNILFSITGSVANFMQMAVQSIDQNSWVNFYGNIGKILLSLVSTFYDLIFLCQHFLLYPARKAHVPGKINAEKDPLIDSFNQPDHSQNV